MNQRHTKETEWMFLTGIRTSMRMLQELQTFIAVGGNGSDKLSHFNRFWIIDALKNFEAMFEEASKSC